MKFIIKFLFFLLVIFILNILFYFLSDDYRFFLEKLKYDDKIVYLNDTKIIDEYDENIEINEDIEIYEGIEIQNITKIEKKQVLPVSNNSISKNDKNIKKEIILGKNYRDILDDFTKKYNLKKIEVNSKLFELTDEFPDYYYEYYSKEITLYFFSTKTYSELFDIFNYLQDSSPFSINKVNNFGEKSFYINLKENIDDNYVRIVISKNGITFGLKIKKEEYNKVKEILLKL